MEQRIYLTEVINGFIAERKSRKLSSGTIEYYTEKLKGFQSYIGNPSFESITPTDIRGFLSDLEADHKPGGLLAYFRAIRTLFNWYEWEFEPDNWKNPIKKVKAPKAIVEPLPGVPLEIVNRLVDSCSNERDKALFLFLVDTGVRASELLNIKTDDIDLITGRVFIYKGKGSKSRVVFLGTKARKTVRKYTKLFNPKEYLWNTDEGEQLTYSGLRQIIYRRSKEAKIKAPGVHDFRRCFAVTMYRNGIDVITISKLMGHSSLEVLKRYLRFNEDDLKQAAMNGSPADMIK